VKEKITSIINKINPTRFTALELSMFFMPQSKRACVTGL